MTQTLDMVSLLTDTEVLDTPDLSTESPLFEKYPLLKLGQIIRLNEEWRHGSRWVLASYEIDGAGLRSSRVFFFNASVREWVSPYDLERIPFPDFRETWECDQIRLVPDHLIPDDWKKGPPEQLTTVVDGGTT